MIPQEEFAEVLWRPAFFNTLVSRYGADAVLDKARVEGLAPYLAWSLPDVAVLADTRRAAVIDEALRAPAMVEACQTLADAGIPAVVFKGGAWAYSVYPEPWCRPRLDLDVLVSPRDRSRAFAALRRAGLTSSGRIPGAYVNHQEAFERALAPGVTFTVDLHWQVSNRVMIAAALPVGDVMARALLPGRGSDPQRTTDVIDSLLIACLHPVAHHPDQLRLIWWLDVARLAVTLPDDRSDEFRARAEESGVACLVAHALQETVRWCFEAPPAIAILEPAFIETLQRAGRDESSRALLRPSRGLLQDLWTDLWALRRTGDRMALLREHLLPPADFMFAQYRTTRRWMLPILHARRLLGGGATWIWGWLRG